jgi:adenine phosphoribosyltransferase
MNHANLLLDEYRALELHAHISPDDVLLKVAEEGHELMKAVEENNAPEIEKEAQDVLINVVSIASRLNLSISPWKDSSFDGKLSDLIALWIRQVRSLEGKYSREKVSLEVSQKTTDLLIAKLLRLSGKESLTDVVSDSIEKFRKRTNDYLPNINLEDFIAAYPDYPKPWILFRDISPLLANPEALKYASYEMAKHAQDADIIAGLDARGFIFGARVAEILGKPFVMVRKKGKLPGKTVGVDYSLEYGDNSIEIQEDAIPPGSKVAIVDDLLATGGTLAAAASLVEKVGGKVEALICLIALDEPFLLEQPARKSLDNYRVESVLHYN